jgi:hypothetical protein
VVKPPPAVDLSPGNIVKQADRAIGGLAKGVRDIDRGLRVIDRTTGSVVGLGSFVLDFLAGAPAPAARVSEGFTMDPAQRKAQQLQRAADREAAARADKALESMAEDLREGRALKSEDIKSLTRPQQEQIRLLGDAAVTQMVEEAQKRAKEYWQGRERERD